MKATRVALAAVAVLAGLATAAQGAPGGGQGGGHYNGGGGGGNYGGGNYGGGGRHYGGGGHYGGGHYYGGGARWYGPGIGIYYGGSPYWWGGYGYDYGPVYPFVPGYGYVSQAYVSGPAAVVTSTPGVTYIERDSPSMSTQRAAPEQAPVPDAAPAAAPGGQWWYLCASPRGAYPYVRECPGGWERLPAVPPGQVR